METSLQQPINSLGEQFRQARETLNLSIEDVAKQLNLRPLVIQAIENNQFLHKSIPVTFMKGYVRSYAKFLRLADDVWQPCMLALTDTNKNDLGKHTRSTQAVNTHSHNHRWIGYVTAIILLGAVGMTGLWWWENHQQSNDERDNLVQNYVDTQEKSPVVVTSEATENNQAQEIPVIATPLTTSTEQANSVNDNSTIAPEQAQGNEPNVNTAVPPNGGNALKKLLAQYSAENTEQATNVENASVPMAVGELHIEVNGSCWISIKNAKGKVLAQKQYKNGDVLDFNENAPYQVIIGAPDLVKITYKGENYPLKVDGRVAKFKLL